MRRRLARPRRVDVHRASVMSQRLTAAAADQWTGGTPAEQTAVRLDVSGTTVSVAERLLAVPYVRTTAQSVAAYEQQEGGASRRF